MKHISQENRDIESSQKAYRYSFWLAIALVIIIALVCLYLAKDLPQDTKLTSVATDLVAACIFAVVFSFLANREFDRVLESKMDLARVRILEEIDSVIKRGNKDYTPSATYNATRGPDFRFNTDLSKDLKNSERFVFRGMTPKYAAIRIMETPHALKLFQALIVDPRATDTLTLRAKDRALNPKNRNKSLQELRDEIRKEIYFGLIALFNCREICPIDIYLEYGTAVVRQEIFDHALYLSFYHTEESRGQTFPATYRYESSTIPFHQYRLDTLRTIDLLNAEVIRFRETDTEKDLLDQLERLSAPEPQTWLAAYESEFKPFAFDFVAESGIGRV